MLRRRDFITFCGSGAVLLPSLQARAQGAGKPAVQIQPKPVGAKYLINQASPFDVGNQTQLFTDRVLVHETEQVAFTFHPAEKHPKNPLIKADQPWEGWQLELYGEVLYDEDDKVFKMWYLGDVGSGVSYWPGPPTRTLYATSRDGITWEKPLVGTLPTLSGSKKHNAVAPVDLGCVIKDKDDPNPAKRYKMVCWFPPRYRPGYQVTAESKKYPVGEYHTMVSPDGLNWKKFSKIPIAPGSGDVINGYYDERRRLYVVWVKIGTVVRGHGRRVFYLMTSKDFQHWTEPTMVWVPDLRDDADSLRRVEEVRPMLLGNKGKTGRSYSDFYGIGSYPADSCTLAFPWVFSLGQFVDNDGPIEVQFAASRDLVNWERPFRTPAIPRGALEAWDSGMVYTASRALRVGDEILLYYGGINATHGNPVFYRAAGTGRGKKYTGSIGLAKWKLDRFVSADGPAEGGVLTTVPMVFSGDRLEINARVKKGGSIVVEVLDAGGRPMDGFGLSEPFRGDDLRHVLRWRGDKAIATLQGKPISLKFHLNSAELYSFAFRQKPKP